MRIENPAKHLKWSKKELLANYFPKTLQYVRQGSKYRRTFEYVRILNMPGIEKVLNMCEYALE